MATNIKTQALVTTDWVAQHATDAGVRVVEVDVDTAAYDQGHVPAAAGWNWTTDLCDTLVRDIVPSPVSVRNAGIGGTCEHERAMSMTRQGAIDTGQSAAIRFGKPWIVWRMPAWPVDCYGVRAVDLGLPSEAETFETLTPNQPGPVGQGSLFQRAITGTLNGAATLSHGVFGMVRV